MAIIIEHPNVQWDELFGLEEVKRSLVPLGGAVLLYGPRGTGKSLVARGSSLLKVPDIMGKWSGELENVIDELFDAANRESEAVIFIDEIDVVMPARTDSSWWWRNIREKFIIQMEGRGKSIVVVGGYGRAVDAPPGGAKGISEDGVRPAAGRRRPECPPEAEGGADGVESDCGGNL
jgi:SpoVK/Ycf46/Vps4 family AAA+-type ATPase